MNWMDIIFIVATLTGAFLGYRSGLVWQLIRIVGWIISLWLAGVYHVTFSTWATDITGTEIPSWVAYLIILILLLLCFFLFSKMIKTVIDALHLELIDRLIGLLLGAVKILIIAAIATLYIYIYAEDDSMLKEGINGSHFAGMFIESIKPFL